MLSDQLLILSESVMRLVEAMPRALSSLAFVRDVPAVVEVEL